MGIAIISKKVKNKKTFSFTYIVNDKNFLDDKTINNSIY